MLPAFKGSQVRVQALKNMSYFELSSLGTFLFLFSFLSLQFSITSKVQDHKRWSGFF